MNGGTDARLASVPRGSCECVSTEKAIRPRPRGGCSSRRARRHRASRKYHRSRLSTGRRRPCALPSNRSPHSRATGRHTPCPPCSAPLLPLEMPPAPDTTISSPIPLPPAARAALTMTSYVPRSAFMPVGRKNDPRRSTAGLRLRLHEASDIMALSQ